MKSFFVLFFVCCFIKGSFAQIQQDLPKQTLLQEDSYFAPLSFTYEVWISGGKFLCCKTNANITEATIEFSTPLKDHMPPFSETSTPRKLLLKKPAGSDVYQFDISNDLYKTRQCITLKLVIDYLSKVELRLYNKKLRILR